MITIVTCTMRPEFMSQVFDNYERQDVKDKEMIIILNKDDMLLAKWRNRARKYENVRVYKRPEEHTLGMCMNYAISKSRYDIVAKFDDDDYYGPKFLKESLDAMEKKKMPIVGKNTSYMYFEAKKALMIYRPGNEKKEVGTVKGGTIVFKKSVWDAVKFPEKRRQGSDAVFLWLAKRAGFPIYSISKAHYVCIRRADISSHTQKTGTWDFMRQCEMVEITDDYIPIVTGERKGSSV
jgi:glycosyltransferase involved in cell wall biosynthesis